MRAYRSHLIGTLALFALFAPGGTLAGTWSQGQAVSAAKALSTRVEAAVKAGAYVGDAGKAAELQAQVNEFQLALAILAGELESGKTRDGTLSTYQWVFEAANRILLDSQSLGIALPEAEMKTYEGLMSELRSAYRKKEAR